MRGSGGLRRPLLTPSASADLARRVRVFALYALIGAGAALRTFEAFHHNPMDELFSDPLRHWTYAKETLSSQPWAFVDPPAFQMWLSVVQKWSLGLPALVASYAAALSVVTPWLWYRFLRLQLRSHELALVGWAAFAWLPSWIAIFRYFMTETLLLPLLGASLWQTMRADRSRSVGAMCAMTALWTAAGLTRGIAIPMAGVAGLWVWLRQPQKAVKACAAALVVLAMVAPFAVRNHARIGLWSPFGSGWPNQIYAASGARDIQLNLSSRQGGEWGYVFGSPSLYAPQLEPLSRWKPRRSGVVKVTANLDRGPADWRAAYESNARRGWDAARLRWENVVLVMLGESWPDRNDDCRVARAASSMRWLWAPLLVVVAVSVVARRRELFERPLVPMLIAVWFAFQAPTLLAVNEGRYRKPLEGLLVVEALLLVDGRARPRRSTDAPSRSLSS